MGRQSAIRRVERLRELLDFAGSGLEIGPLCEPLFTREDADIAYVDLYDREGLMAAYTGHQNVLPDDIPEIDFPLWDGMRIRSLAEAVKDGAPFDWAVASHVIEHVPNLVGWLHQVEEVTQPDGALALVVPDRRYTFDAHRPPTTMGEILQAHYSDDQVPSVRAVFDHHRSAVVADARRLHKRGPSRVESCCHDLSFVQVQMEKARRGEYVDCHVWTYTDRSFPEIIAELSRLGLTGWSVESVTPTPKNDIEFYVVLRRGLTVEPPEALDLPDWVIEHVNLRQQVDAQRRRADRLRADVDALRGSRRFKIGSLVGAPFDAWRHWRR